MRQRTALVPFLPLALLLPLTACDQQINVTASDRLESLLPSGSDYPAGYDVESVDMAELDGTSTSGTDFDSVEPPECAAAMNEGPADLPEESAEGAGQVAVNSRSGPSIYTYVLVTGDFDEADLDTSAYESLLDTCSTMTVVNEGVEMEATLRSSDSPALPDDGGKFVMEMTADGLNMATWTAWGQIEDVHFILIRMDLDTGGDLSAGELAGECEGDFREFRECRERVTQERAREALDEADTEFDEFLTVALRELEQGV
ncbi:hypothetical protein [Nocardiopsis sp. SBT366]|uniref:hypothetical protein n=1 Tax=Nocardiopsis sp. SBT366 TaxID=1580529 RepID=UPI00066EB392|nr:hypothetical protein [Nocardiopsis sp. SBT366]